MNAIHSRFHKLLFLGCWLAIQIGLVGWPSAALGQSEAIESGKAALRASSSDSVRASRSLVLGNAFLQYNYDSAMRYIRQSITLGKATKNSPLMVRGYAALGYAHLRQGNAAGSLPYLRQAEQLHSHRARDSTALEIGILMAIAVRSQGNYADGLQRCLSLLRTYEPPHQPYPHLGMVYTELGVIYDHLHQYDKAGTYHRKRLAFAKKSAKQRDVGVAYLNLGTFYTNIKQHDAAERYYRLALTLARRHGYLNDAVTLLSNLGDLAHERHRYQEAIRRHTEALQLAMQFSEVQLHGWNLLMLARDHQALHQYSTALAYADRALTVYKIRPSVDVQQKALFTKAELLEQVGRYREALHITRQATLLRDSLMGREKQKAIAEVQAAYNFERKQNQITTLHKNLTIQKKAQQTTEFKLRLAQRGRLLAWITILLLSLVLAVAYWSFRSQRKAQRLLQFQKDEIGRQAEQLAELNRTKDQLFSLISHDLRSPVARLKQGFYQLSHSHPADAPRHQPIDQLENQVDHILALLTNLLDWSHSQLKGFKSNLQPINLTDTVAELISELSDQVQRKGIGVLNQLPASLMVQADTHQLHSVLRNVLNNAVKFTPVDGFVRLYAIIETEQVTLRIQDTGIGMSENELARLLTDPLVRVGTENEPGTGLGLRLCRDLLARQNGSLHITSQPHKGTTVAITLVKAQIAHRVTANTIGEI